METTTTHKLVGLKSGREALRCLCVAEAVGFAPRIELVRDISQLQTAQSSLWPQLTTPFGPLYSSVSICKYIIRSAEDRTAAEELLPSAETSPMRWTIEKWIAWTRLELQPVLFAGVPALATKLAVLEEALISKDYNSSFVGSTSSSATDCGGTAAVQVGYKPTLADIFVHSALIRQRKLIDSTKFPHLTVLLNTVQAWAPLRSSLEAVPSAQPLPSLPSAEAAAKQKFYLTTAINYTNGLPHIGHAYEAITADALCRYHRTFGREVFFLTGTDEHGQKIAGAADAALLKPIEICDRYATKFQELNVKLHISQDYFIRTTMDHHKRTCQHLWDIVKSKDDIYLSTYSGWYNVREEAFLTERDAAGQNYKDKETGAPLQKMEEASYFFRMSKYQSQLIQHITDHTDFIQPASRRNEILSRLKEPLEDLSVSRTTFKWGIPVPEADSEHVMYVWFDALTNYLSGVDYFGLGDAAAHGCAGTSALWPASVHIIGKDITWFHTVIWPCMLLSADIPLPKAVFAHGFVHAADGRKMSKSFGTAIDPLDVLQVYPADSFRYFLLKESAFGSDVKFNLDSMRDFHNGDLADILGNLVHRAVGLAAKYSAGAVPKEGIPSGRMPFDAEQLAADSEKYYTSFQLQEAIEAALSACRDTNKYLTEMAPWTLGAQPTRQRAVVRAILEATYYVAHFLLPAMPTAAHKIFERLNTPPTKIAALSTDFDNLVHSTAICVAAEVLFQKIEKVEQPPAQTPSKGDKPPPKK